MTGKSQTPLSGFKWVLGTPYFVQGTSSLSEVPILAYCDKDQLPVDFLTTHYYPTDAFGKIGADTLTQLEDAPRDVMRQRAEIRKLSCQDQS